MSREKIKYISYGQSVDGTNYCSGVETLAENFIEDNEEESVLVYPSKDGWASVKTAEYKMTDENVSFIVPLPIYKIKRILLRPENTPIKFIQVGVGDLTIERTAFKNKKGEALEYIDITPYVLPSEVKRALPVLKDKPSIIENITQQNTFFYDKGSTEIKIRSDKIDPYGLLNEEPVYYLLARSINRAIIRAQEETNDWYTYYAENSWTGLIDEIRLFNEDQEAGFPYDGQEGKTPDPRGWQFRIEYVPLTSKTKMRARKNEKTTVDYIQPHNQRAEINAVSAFGKNMWLTAQKTGTKTVTVVKRYAYLSDIPPIGSTVWHDGRKYVIVANSYKMTNTMFVQVTHTLSENWTSKSKHVSVDQKYRNYRIPQDILWRNLYWEDFLVASGSPKNVYKGDSATNDKFIELSDCLQLLDVDSQYDRCIDTFSWIFDVTDKNDETIIDTSKQGVGVTLPCATYGVANSIVFSAEFKDQLSAGLRRYLKGENVGNESGDDLNEEYLCEEGLYCDQNGKLPSATVVLSDGFYSANIVGDTYKQDKMDDYARTLYPIIKGAEPFKAFGLPMVLNYPVGFPIAKDDENYALFSKKFYIDKQPGEAIKFTYQIHCVGEDGCVFGNKFCEDNTLIKSNKENKNLRLWLSSNYIREGSDKLDPIETDDHWDINNDDAEKRFYAIEAEENIDGSVFSLKIKNEPLEVLANSGGRIKSWAITDEENNLYVGRNNDTTGQIYFTMTHKRI